MKAPWSKKPKTSNPSCSVRGVWATAHLDSGDMDSGPPERVEVECSLITFTFPVGVVKKDSTMRWSTVYMGPGVAARCKVDPPMRVLAGDYLHIVQPVSISDLEYTPGAKPHGCPEGWA